jgi:hypothetical protein
MKFKTCHTYACSKFLCDILSKQTYPSITAWDSGDDGLLVDNDNVVTLFLKPEISNICKAYTFLCFIQFWCGFFFLWIYWTDNFLLSINLFPLCNLTHIRHFVHLNKFNYNNRSKLWWRQNLDAYQVYEILEFECVFPFWKKTALCICPSVCAIQEP